MNDGRNVLPCFGGDHLCGLGGGAMLSEVPYLWDPADKDY